MSDDNNLEEELTASWDEPTLKLNPRNRPIIKLTGGSLDRNLEIAEKCLSFHNKQVYKRGRFIVTPINLTISVDNGKEISVLHLVEVDVWRMIDIFTKTIDFQIFDGRSSKWRSINCPEELARVYLSRKGEWNLPTLTSVINTPTLRPDGSILDIPGYDEKTGILFLPQQDFPKLDSSPTKDDALKALDLLKKPIHKFPFLPDASQSVVLSAFLTSLIRQSIPNAPLHAFTAPTMGSGKSKLINMISILATGHEAVMISQGGDNIEMEKRLGTELMAGNNQIVFDNCTTPIGGQLFCQAVTEENLTIRILGQSKRIMVPNKAMFFADGNNLIISEDMTRRSILCSIDPKVEKPELRSFDFDPIKMMKDNRLEYIHASLTIIRAYQVSNKLFSPPPPLGSFDKWSEWIRNAIIWLDEPDPCNTMAKIREKDPPLNDLRNILTQWKQCIGNEPVTSKELITKATKQKLISVYNITSTKGISIYPEFVDALFSIAGKDSYINSQRLGIWLNKNEGRVSDNMRIISRPKRNNMTVWMLEDV